MRLAILLACAMGWSATAHASPLQLKRVTDKYPVEAMRAFAAGLVMHQLEDLHNARNAYDSANRHSPQANTYYNIADLYLRSERPDLAIEALRRYLELAPVAADRAEVLRLIQDLSNAPAKITLGGQLSSKGEPAAILLLDGVLVGTSPMLVRPTAGRHLAERITATTYASRDFEARPGMIDYVALTATQGPTGNVVITGLDRRTPWREGKVTFVGYQRFVLPVGRYTITGSDGHPRLCSPVQFEVKSTRQLTHVRVELGARGSSDCAKIVRVRTQTLTLPPGGP
ncbi:MAG: tetratricopeptide repeat protein [Deltaproteobacteria bacterium]|nr:tetratricopeptide repeat protein [Deltaproteobacteria bacterium]MDQ3296942.1 tetratricopeptide repeat protein [Myxococcota bacterium]